MNVSVSCKNSVQCTWNTCFPCTNSINKLNSNINYQYLDVLCPSKANTHTHTRKHTHTHKHTHTRTMPRNSIVCNAYLATVYLDLWKTVGHERTGELYLWGVSTNLFHTPVYCEFWIDVHICQWSWCQQVSGTSSSSYWTWYSQASWGISAGLTGRSSSRHSPIRITTAFARSAAMGSLKWSAITFFHLT